VCHRPGQLGAELPAVLHQMQAEPQIRTYRPDVVHDHTLTGAVAASGRSIPTVLTAHGEAVGDYGDLLAAASATSDVVAISRSQVRGGSDRISWGAVVPNGIRVDRYTFGRRRSSDLAFLGRMAPEKGCAEAIRVALRAGRRLLVAARIQGDAEQRYFDQHVRPFLGSGVVYVGELDFAGKVELLASSAGLLFPLQWEEPYGLVVAEAQACGTPVVTLRRGAMPELVRHGRTGYLGGGTDDLVDAVRSLDALSPRACRQHAEEALDVALTAAGYEREYERVLARGEATPIRSGVAARRRQGRPPVRLERPAATAWQLDRAPREAVE
jgi:glycosyltransferase involved in cell wall biosynthesis